MIPVRKIVHMRTHAMKRKNAQKHPFSDPPLLKKQAVGDEVPADMQTRCRRIRDKIQSTVGVETAVECSMVDRRIYTCCPSCYKQVYIGEAKIYTNETPFVYHYNECKKDPQAFYLTPEAKDGTFGRGDECQTVADLLDRYSKPCKGGEGQQPMKRKCKDCGKVVSVNDNIANLRRHLQSADVSCGLLWCR